MRKKHAVVRIARTLCFRCLSQCPEQLACRKMNKIYFLLFIRSSSSFVILFIAIMLIFSISWFLLNFFLCICTRSVICGEPQHDQASALSQSGENERNNPAADRVDIPDLNVPLEGLFED